MSFAQRAVYPWVARPEYFPQNYLNVTADFSLAAWNTVADHEVFTVTGQVRLVIIPICTLDLTSSGGGTLALGVAGTTNAFIAATTATLIDAGEYWLTTTPVAHIPFTGTGSPIDRIVNDLDVGYAIATAVTQAGKIDFHCWWDPLLPSGGLVVAGTGVAL